MIILINPYLLAFIELFLKKFFSTSKKIKIKKNAKMNNFNIWGKKLKNIII